MKLLTALLFTPLVFTQLVHGQEVKRPRILGVAHIALFVSDIEKSRAFYKDFLGYGEVFSLNKPDGTLSLTFLKINERQYIELFPQTEPGTDRLNHISIETDDAEAMRAYLGSKGIKVPDKVPKGRIGNSNFNVKDPDGHTVEIVQYEPAGWSVRDKGKAIGPSRVSPRMMHLGIIVGAVGPAMKFYRDVLGFTETWRGSSNGTQLSWINLKVPDGDDYIELMLYDKITAPDKRGGQHHIALEVPSVAASLSTLEKKSYRSQYAKPMEPKTGINRKRQLNLFDPDGTRIELMEPVTIDGKPTPSSTALPPH